MPMTTAIRTLVLLALSLPLANCVTTEEQLAQRDNARCTARGLQPNTKPFEECLAQVASDRLTRMENNRRDMMERPVSLSR
jgi:hypothetical protein